MGTRKKVNTNEPSKKPGEAAGRDTEEIKAAEQAPDTAQETNPVGEATQHESKDPYAEGKHIANPEPNNGKGEDADQEFNPADQNAQAVPSEVPNSDAEEQAEVAEGRTEDGETPAAAEGSGQEQPAEEDPLAAEANEKAV